MRHLDLFSGIGGFALAAEWVWPDCEHIFCEIDGFCQDVLEKHWPYSPIYGDIKQLTKQRYIQDFGEPADIDLLTGGFPCQPFSVAGKQLAQRDDRHLWPQMLRVINDFRPRWVIGENVAGIIKLALDQVLSDLEGAGYATRTFVIPACAVNAPHRRDRVWIVAHADDDGLPARQIRQGMAERNDCNPQGTQTSRQPTRLPSPQPAPDPNGQRRQGSGQKAILRLAPQPRQPARSIEGWYGGWPVSKPRTVGVDDGVPDRTHRIKALGNAIVPQVAAEIFQAIKTADQP